MWSVRMCVRACVCVCVCVRVRVCHVVWCVVCVCVSIGTHPFIHRSSALGTRPRCQFGQLLSTDLCDTVRNALQHGAIWLLAHHRCAQPTALENVLEKPLRPALDGQRAPRRHLCQGRAQMELMRPRALATAALRGTLLLRFFLLQLAHAVKGHHNSRDRIIDALGYIACMLWRWRRGG